MMDREDWRLRAFCLPPPLWRAGVGGTSQGVPDRFQHLVPILEYGIVPESQDPESLRVQPLRPRGILIDLPSVLTSIEFYDQAPLETDEIDSIIRTRNEVCAPRRLGAHDPRLSRRRRA